MTIERGVMVRGATPMEPSDALPRSISDASGNVYRATAERQVLELSAGHLPVLRMKASQDISQRAGRCPAQDVFGFRGPSDAFRPRVELPRQHASQLGS